MIRNFVTLALCAAALCGCVLQSKAPVYGDGQSELVFGNKNGRTQTASWRNDAWEPDKEQMAITVSGNHYEVTDKNSRVLLNFVRLQDSSFVLQAVESGSAAVYLLADVKDGMAVARPLACDDLKKNELNATWISYEGDDCFIRPEADATALFTSLLKTPGEAALRMEVLH